MNCLICEKELKLNEVENINDGTSFQIQCSYGSSFDGFIYNAVICDHCLQKKAIDKTIVFEKDYVQGISSEKHDELVKINIQ